MTTTEQRPLSGYELLVEYLAWREEAVATVPAPAG